MRLYQSGSEQHFFLDIPSIYSESVGITEEIKSICDGDMQNKNNIKITFFFFLSLPSTRVFIADIKAFICSCVQGGVYTKMTIKKSRAFYKCNCRNVACAL